MILTNNARRILAASAFAVAAVAAPFAASAIDTGGSVDSVACRAHFGNIEDGICLDGPGNSNGFTIGTPNYSACGGTAASTGDCGFSSGPLLPGTTINQPLG